MKDTEPTTTSQQSLAEEDTEQGKQPLVLQLPLDDDKVASLRAGQWIHLSGSCYVIGYQASQELLCMLQEGRPLPLELRHATVYFSTPGHAPMGEVIGSLAPHHTDDFEDLILALLEQGAQGLIGRGPLQDDVTSRLKRKRGVYFVTVAGAGALLARTVYQAQVIALEELGREAIRLLKVENFPCVVAIDGFGRNLLQPQMDLEHATKDSEP